MDLGDIENSKGKELLTRNNQSSEDYCNYRNKEVPLKYLNYLDSFDTCDVSIICKDGTLLANRLVLASISYMLYGALKDNIGDESEETLNIINHYPRGFSW